MSFAHVSAAAAAAVLFLGAPAAAQPIMERLAAANVETGESLFRQCAACHTLEKGGPSRAGPNLFGVIGRPKAGAEGFRYSPALAGAGGAWTPEDLDAFLENPRAAIVGTRMTFRGLADAQARADLIAFLNTHSDAPLALAEGGAAPSGDGAAEPSEGDFGLFVPGEGVEETFYTCTACHSEMIVVQQGKTRERWDKLFDWMIESQGMPELLPEERNLILDYLAEHYNTDRPNFPKR